jgi:hypothetical protein
VGKVEESSLEFEEFLKEFVGKFDVKTGET